MRKIQVIQRLLLSAATLCTAPPAFAQVGETVEDDVIVVTARRIEENLQDVPISMTVFSQSQLDSRNIVSTSDLAAYTPSLSVDQSYGLEKATYALRGFNQESSTAPTVGVYFADVVGVRAQGGTVSGNNVGVGAFTDLQNVQVLKGPQGTLFGRNTTGGAVLLVPRKPDGEFGGYVEGTIGNYDQRRVQAAVNVPLADTFKVRMSVDRNQRDGYMKNRSGIGVDRYNDTNYIYGRLSVVADLTPDLENYTIVHYSDSDTAGRGSRLVICDPKASSFTAITALAACDQIARHDARGDDLLTVDMSNPDPYLKLKQWQVINTTTWRASDTLTIKNIVSYGEFRERASWSLNGDNFRISNPAPDLSALRLPPLKPGTPFQYVILNPSPGQDNAAESTFTEELQIQGQSGDGRLNYVVGGYLEFSRPMGWNAGRTSIFLDCKDTANLDCQNNPVFAGYIADSRTKYEFDNHGVFAQGSYKLSDRLTLTAGVRYTFDKVLATGQSTRLQYLPLTMGPGATICDDTVRFNRPDPNRPGRTLPLEVTDSSQCKSMIETRSKKPTWLLNLDYKPLDDMLLYAKWARGYRQGGINLTGVGAETWFPEQIDTYELGAKASFSGAVRGHLNIAAFYNDFRNQQVGASLIAKPGQGSGASTIVNAGKSTIKGVEVEASATVFDSLRLDAGYAYLDAQVKEMAIPVLPAESPFAAIEVATSAGDRLIMTPRHRLTLTGTYTLPIDESLGRLSAGVTYTYTDKQLTDTRMNMPMLLKVLPATGLVNVNLDWENALGSPLDIAVFATNVTNKIYPVAAGSGYTSAGFGAWVMGQPRMYGLRVRYSLGR